MKPIDLVKELSAVRQERDAAIARLRRAGSEAGDLMKELAALKLALDLAESRNGGLCARIVDLEDAAVAALGVPN